MTRRILPNGFIAIFMLIAQISLAIPPCLVAWYRFSPGQQFGRDLSGKGHDVKIIGRIGTENDPEGLVLTGNGGLEIPAFPSLSAQNGFTVEMWVRFNDVNNDYNLIAKDGAYFIRIDPPEEGGRISFFVNSGNTLEPRVFGPVARVGHLYHIVAVWNQTRADLWVDDHLYSENRMGSLASENSPILIGGSYKWAPNGLNGVIREIRIFNRALSRGDVLANNYGLDAPSHGIASNQTYFKFSSGLLGWIGHGITGLHSTHQGLICLSGGESSTLLRPHLQIPTDNNRYAAIRMSVSAGESAKLLCVTTHGSFIIPFDIQSDGFMHSYILNLAEHIRWGGELLAAALQPSDKPAKVRLSFIRFARTPDAPSDLFVRDAYLKSPLGRAERNCPVAIKLENRGGVCKGAEAKLILPAGVYFSGPAHMHLINSLRYKQSVTLLWSVKSTKPQNTHLRLIVSVHSHPILNTGFPVSFASAFHRYKAKYPPPPKIAQSDYMVGAMMCPLWTQGSRQGGWQEITPFPNREPLLGWYDENSPEATDWQIKWCLEHGISYFVYCWYRVGEGGPVKQMLGQALHQGLFHSRYGAQFKFAIMWENANGAGVSSEKDLMENLLPYWIKQYFKRPNYLKVDGKPLLFIYDPPKLISNLGGVQNARRAMDEMRNACRQAGFEGLTLIGEYRGMDPRVFQQISKMGMNYSFAYCWPISGQPSPSQAIAEQRKFWQDRRKLNILPSLVTVSMGWNPSPWYPTKNRWRLPPSDFKTLCMNARKFINESPSNGLQNHMVLIDNWNEFGEGHYIEPTRQYGFGYLDAIRSVFTQAKGSPDDVTPEDVGLGPYDHLFQNYLRIQHACAKRVLASGGNRLGLIGWWRFNRVKGFPITYDYSGHGHGGQIIDAGIVNGEHGDALQCHGGCVSVPASSELCPSKAITVEAWIKVEAPEQQDRWFVNCVGGNGVSGYRMGVTGGRLCFEIPKTAWSHSLSAPTPLPLNQWIFVTGDYDGANMRLYENGKQCAELNRGGRIRRTNQPLCLGNYAVGHSAHFIGLLSDVRIYSKALTPVEITEDSAK